MNLYSSLSAIGFLKNSYVLKFMFLAFLGIHVPLLGVIAFIVFFEDMLSPMTVFWVVLALTLIATAITLMVIKKLIDPITKTSKALELYRNNRVIPNLPIDYTDEAGVLMHNISFTIKNIENLLNEKQDTAYLLSHDLKNFAEAPATLAKLIEEENVSGKVKEYTKLIISSSERQTDFLTTFISILKEEDELSKAVIKVHTIDFVSIVESVKEAVAARCKEKNVTLKVDLKTPSVMLRADKKLLTHVLINLVENAIKFSYSGGEVLLSIGREHSSLKITVQDQGIGFNDMKKAELFQKFTPMSRLGTADEKSTGIGLYLCRQILKKSDGYIGAHSDGADKGSTFTIDMKVYRRK